MHKNINKRKDYYLGKWSEYFAIFVLFIKGYKILQHRYQNKSGEIDLIARKSGYIIFIEVKSSHKKRNLNELITEHQVSRISEAAEIFLMKYKRYQDLKIRFDIIHTKPFAFFYHIKNAW